MTPTPETPAVDAFLAQLREQGFAPASLTLELPRSDHRLAALLAPFFPEGLPPAPADDDHLVTFQIQGLARDCGDTDTLDFAPDEPLDEGLPRYFSFHKSAVRLVVWRTTNK